MSPRRRNNLLRAVPFGRPPVSAVEGGQGPSAPDGYGDRDAYWRRSCFYSSPIGGPRSDEREHADMFQESLVEPAIEALDPSMEVIRADELPSSSITASVIEHVVNSRLLIADLSFHNPNVLYEVGLRHARRKPFVLISRALDPIPSNLRDARVVRMHTDSVSRFVTEMDTRRVEIAEYARWAISPEGEDYFRS